ncbi:hypothetical protein KKP97_07075 [Methanothermococcus sp. SCGC AD-155-C09]|nr:hypothetical protein [Methanothermococcus sp. SCGC AD-155-C09]
MLKRWDTRNYDIKLILEVFDWINVPFESMGIIKEGSQYKGNNKGIDYKRIRKTIPKICRDKGKSNSRIEN